MRTPSGGDPRPWSYPAAFQRHRTAALWCGAARTSPVDSTSIRLRLLLVGGRRSVAPVGGRRRWRWPGSVEWKLREIVRFPALSLDLRQGAGLARTGLPMLRAARPTRRAPAL